MLQRSFRALGLVLLFASTLRAETPPPCPFEAKTVDGASLEIVENVAIMTVAGSPEEMGRQHAELLGEKAKRLASFPPTLMLMLGQPQAWPIMQKKSEVLAERLPERFRRELDAIAEETELEPSFVYAANFLADMYRGQFGCSSLIVLGERSAIDGPLFGRNLDFQTAGVLQRYSLLMIFHPEGRRSFASVSLPSMAGSLSGMNDAGLAVAVHVSGASADHAPMFNDEGVPYAFLFRMILEDCATVDEAEALLRKHARTTKFNLAVCDRESAAVFECTPKTVARRDAVDGVLVCTNHFRTDELSVTKQCGRYETLWRGASKSDPLTIGRLATLMDDVASQPTTMQTMIFEPEALRVRLAVGATPSSKLPLVPIDLEERLKKAGTLISADER